MNLAPPDRQLSEQRGGKFTTREDDGPFITGNLAPNYGNGLDFQRRAAFPAPPEVPPHGKSNGMEDSKPPMPLPPMQPRSQLLLDDRRHSIGSSMGGKYFTEVTMARENLLGPRRPRPHKIWKKKFIKLLIVGDSGLGKTTLIKTLLSTPGEPLQVHDGTSTSAEQFRKEPESLCSTITWKDDEDRVVWVYRIQDTPGYGDDLDIGNNIKLMMDYIQRQNMEWLQLEMCKDRKEDLSEVEDPRVDVVLYALPPHRLRPIDLRYMHELSQAVPVLPVVTKADTMTIREATMYRQEVRKYLSIDHTYTKPVYNKLQNPNLHGLHGKINVFQFDKDTLERAGISDASGSGAIPPFLVIASNDKNEDLNNQEPPVFWPERRYPWGTAEAFNPEHSDLLHLRALLLKEALEEISKCKRQRYEVWRRNALGGWRIGKQLRKIIMWTVVPAALALYAGKKGTTMKDIQAMPGQLNRSVRKFLHLEHDHEEEEVAPPPPPAAKPQPVAPVDPKRGRK